MLYLFYISAQFVIATACLILGLYIFLVDTRSLTNRLFFVTSLLLIGVILFTILIQLIPVAQTVKRVQGFYNILLIFFLLSSLYFCLVFTKRKLPVLLKALLAVSTAVVDLFFITRSNSLLVVERINGLWVYKFINNGFWFLIYSPLLGLIIFLMIFTLFKHSRSANTHKERLQAKVMMTAILSSCGAGFFFLMVLPLSSAYRAPLLTPFFFAVYLFGVFYALQKYKLMNFTIRGISQEILSYIRDTIIILDPQLKIVEIHGTQGEILGREKTYYNGRPFNEIIKETDDLSNRINKLLVEDTLPCQIRMSYKNGEDEIITDTSVSRVCDRFGDFIALLVVSRESRGIRQFQSYFKLTSREMEIVLLTITGISNSRIAEKLEITKRTVETHQTNIYNKLGIGNKLELAGITTDFGIKSL